MEDKAIVSVTLSSPHPSQRSTQIITHRFLYARVQADFSSLMSSWSSSDIWCAVKSICTFYTLKRNHKAKPPLQSSTLPHIRLMELSVTQTTLPQPVSAVCDVLISLSLSGPAIHTNPRLSWLHYTLLHVSLFIRAVNKPLSSQRRPLACKDHKQHVVWISKILKVGRRYDLRAMQCEIPRRLVDSSTVYLGQWAAVPCSVIAIDHLHQSRAPQCTMGGMCKLDQCSPTPPNPNNLHWCSV